MFRIIGKINEGSQEFFFASPNWGFAYIYKLGYPVKKKVPDNKGTEGESWLIFPCGLSLDPHNAVDDPIYRYKKVTL